MVHESSRNRFNASRLVRVLTDLAGTDTCESKQPFADRLGQWLSLADALSLYSALNAGTAGTSAVPTPSPSPECETMRKTFERLRSVLTASIRADDVLAPGNARDVSPAPAANAAGEGAADFAPWHRHYVAHQRDMSAKIAPLRATVRAALARRSPALQRLAALDAMMDQALAARERDLLATVPALLQRHFEQLRDAHRAAQIMLHSPAEPPLPSMSDMPAEAHAADNPDRPMQPGGWVAEFGRQMQAVLLAELELRLQPVAGLLAALENEETSKQ
ncbi:MAG TPA: DUF3348 domain-containing protein [Rhodocyclaceae bacterium]|nr:DUF3348 domain-containing protein [Rhodocyclaceae bacterium]